MLYEVITRFVPAYGETLAVEAQPMMFEAEVGGATIYVLDVELNAETVLTEESDSSTELTPELQNA